MYLKNIRKQFLQKKFMKKPTTTPILEEKVFTMSVDFEQ